MAELGRIMRTGTDVTMDSTNPQLAPPVETAERRDVRWTHELPRDAVLDLVASRSYVIRLSESRRRELLGEVRRLLDEHPALAGSEVVRMPYVARCAVAYPRS